MEHGLKAVYMGIAAILFVMALWILLKYDEERMELNRCFNNNQRNAEVIPIG